MSYILCIRAAIVKGYRHYNCADLSFKISIFKSAYLHYIMKMASKIHWNSFQENNFVTSDILAVF